MFVAALNIKVQYNEVKTRCLPIRAIARFKDGVCTRVAPHLSRDVRGTAANSEDRERTPPRIKVRRGTNFGVLGRTRGMKLGLSFSP